MSACHVCAREVEPDRKGEVQHEAVARSADRQIVWGPVVVHDDCRLLLTTPWDESPFTELIGYRANP